MPRISKSVNALMSEEKRKFVIAELTDADDCFILALTMDFKESSSDGASKEVQKVTEQQRLIVDRVPSVAALNIAFGLVRRCLDTWAIVGVIQEDAEYGASIQRPTHCGCRDMLFPETSMVSSIFTTLSCP